VTPTEQFVNFLIKNKPAIDAADNVIADSVGMMEAVLAGLRIERPETTAEEVVGYLRRVDFRTAMAMIAATHAAELLKEIVKEYVELKTKATRKPKFYQRWWWAVKRKLH